MYRALTKTLNVLGPCESLLKLYELVIVYFYAAVKMLRTARSYTNHRISAVEVETIKI